MNNFRKLRKERGLTQVQVSLKARASLVTIGQVERQDHCPNLLVRRRLAKALGVKASEIWPSVDDDDGEGPL